MKILVYSSECVEARAPQADREHPAEGKRKDRRGGDRVRDGAAAARRAAAAGRRRRPRAQALLHAARLRGRLHQGRGPQS